MSETLNIISSNIEILWRDPFILIVCFILVIATFPVLSLLFFWFRNSSAESKKENSMALLVFLVLLITSGLVLWIGHVYSLNITNIFITIYLIAFSPHIVKRILRVFDGIRLKTGGAIGVAKKVDEDHFVIGENIFKIRSWYFRGPYLDFENNDQFAIVYLPKNPKVFGFVSDI